MSPQITETKPAYCLLQVCVSDVDEATYTQIQLEVKWRTFRDTFTDKLNIYFIILKHYVN